MPAAVDTNEQAPHAVTERTTDWHAWVPLALACAPIVVAMARALLGDWRPEFDAGYFYARALDVFTDRHPFVGAWSTSALFAETSFNNVGALQLVLLAPFARLGPQWVAVGTGLVNVAAVVCTWWCARRLFGFRGVAAVMAATLVLQVVFGAMAFVDPRQQLALLLPFWALIWATVVVARGGHGALLPWLGFATLALQTHFTYVFIVGFLVVVGTAGYVWCHRRDLGLKKVRRWVVGSLAVAGVLWAPTLWDQFARSGNLGRALRGGSDQPSAGWTEAARISADGPLTGMWTGSLRSFREPWSHGTVASWLIVVVWLAALVGAATFGRRVSPVVRLLLLATASVLLVGLGTAARIPSYGAFGLLPQNYFWLWPIAAAGLVGLLAAGVAHLDIAALRSWLVAAPLLALAAVATPSGMTFPQWDVAAELRAVGGRTMLDDLRTRLDDALERLDVGPAVVVVPTTFRLAIPDFYNILGVIRSAGLDLHFPEASDDLHRFGEGRCETGRERWRLKIVVGANRPELSGFDVLLARTDPTSAAASDELASTRAAMLDRLRAGAFQLALDDDADTGPHAELRRILADPAGAHPDLWYSLPALVRSGDATIPAGSNSAYDRWLDLEVAHVGESLLVFLTPNYYPQDGCAT